MKKNMILSSVVVLFMAVLGCRSADAGILGGLKGLIHNTSANIAYHTDMAACFAERDGLRYRIDEEFNRFNAGTYGQHDLRRQLIDCWYDFDVIAINIDECREMNGDAYSSDGYGSAFVEGPENQSDRGVGIDRRLFVRFADFMVNGICVEPKTDKKREECLSKCDVMLEWERVQLARATYRADHVVESMGEDINSCRGMVAMLEADLADCKNGGNVGDTVDPLSSPEGDVMVCTVDAEGNEVCTTEQDDTCTLDPEGNAFCSADPSEGDETCTLDPNDPEGKKLCPNSPSLDPSADIAADSDNAGTGGDQEPASFMDLVKRLVQNFKKDPSSSSILRRVSAMQ